MNRAVQSCVGRTFVAGSLAVPLLVAYLYVGGCGHGKRGVVMSARALGFSISAAWCSSS